MGLPAQIVADEGVMAAVGDGLTITGALAVAVQPFALVTVTVKVVVEVGEPVMEAVVAPLTNCMMYHRWPLKWWGSLRKS